MKTIALAPTHRELRIVSGAMLGAAVVWPWLPAHPPLACPLRALTGVPCPLCGMTRAVVAAAHGHVVRSLAFNPAGIVIVVAAILVVARPALIRRIRVPIWALCAVTAGLWLWNAGFNPTFHQLLLSR